MENFIMTKNNAFTNDFCDEIIDLYNCDEILNAEKNENIDKNYYKKQLNKNTSKCITAINSQIQKTLKDFNEKNYQIIDKKFILFDNYDFLKFDKDKGYISYFTDYTFIENIYSVFEFIIFLNDIQEGGHVEILGNFKIKPQKGTLLIFPSGWCFPYCHKIPISDDKYIVSGKIFTKF